MLRPIGILSRAPSALTAALLVEVIALAILQSPNERFWRYIGFDSAIDLTMQDLLARGFRPTIDFGCVYGLLTLVINRIWYGVAGFSPTAFRVLAVLATCLTAWGMARFVEARQIGWAGRALVLLAMPDVLFPTYGTVVHVVEPALLVHALAEQARGRRDRALMLATIACFVKPSMGYVLGFWLLVAIALNAKGRARGWAYWASHLGPAATAGVVLIGLLAGRSGIGPLIRTLVPAAGAANYRLEHYGFFSGTGRAFWDQGWDDPTKYFRYEVAFWLTGSAWLVAGGLASFWRLARGRSDDERALDAEAVACCASLHVVFVTCFFGNRYSWTNYFTILILGLAALSKGGRGQTIVTWCLAAMLLVNFRSKVAYSYRDWSAASPGVETLGLWATPAERAEWRTVLDLTRGEQPVLLSPIDGSVPLVPRFAPPVAAYFYPGLTLPTEADRKADQLAAARMIVTLVPRDWRGFTLWPGLAAALAGCECVFDGESFHVYRRVRPSPIGRGRMSGPPVPAQGP